jgi:hypothetical protein
MPKHALSVKTFTIDGQQVSCHESGGQHLWHCSCADFKRRLKQFGEGFCAHTAVAMMDQISSDAAGDLESTMSAPRS